MNRIFGVVVLIVAMASSCNFRKCHNSNINIINFELRDDKLVCYTDTIKCTETIFGEIFIGEKIADPVYLNYRGYINVKKGDRKIEFPVDSMRFSQYYPASTISSKEMSKNYYDKLVNAGMDSIYLEFISYDGLPPVIHERWINGIEIVK